MYTHVVYTMKHGYPVITSRHKSFWGAWRAERKTGSQGRWARYNSPEIKPLIGDTVYFIEPFAVIFSERNHS